jgi:hypothetical protein
MTRSARALHVEGLDALLRGRMAALVKARDWELLREVARLATQDAPLDLATTDAARFRAYREAVAHFHLGGWSAMTPDRIDIVVKEAGAIVPDTIVPDKGSVARALTETTL